MRSILFSLLLVGFSLAWGKSNGVSVAAYSSQQAGQDKPKIPSTPDHDQGPQIAEGLLQKIDVKNQLIWIKPAERAEIEFSYTNQTAIEGAGDSVEGLENRNGSRLRIYFQTLGGTNTALKIQVLPAEAAPTKHTNEEQREVVPGSTDSYAEPGGDCNSPKWIVYSRRTAGLAWLR